MLKTLSTCVRSMLTTKQSQLVSIVLKEKISETGDSELSLTQSCGGQPLNIKVGKDKKNHVCKNLYFL